MTSNTAKVQQKYISNLHFFPKKRGQSRLSRIIHLTAYLASTTGFLTDFLNLACPKLNSWSFPMSVRSNQENRNNTVHFSIQGSFLGMGRARSAKGRWRRSGGNKRRRGDTACSPMLELTSLRCGEAILSGLLDQCGSCPCMGSSLLQSPLPTLISATASNYHIVPEQGDSFFLLPSRFLLGLSNRETGKCSLQTPSPRSTKQSIDRQVWGWETTVNNQYTIQTCSILHLLHFRWG